MNKQKALLKVLMHGIVLNFFGLNIKTAYDRGKY
jgi:hypothetical protein